MRILTIGTFDCVHAGHINLLQSCKEYGDVVVGVNSDEFIERYKGKPPLFTYKEREELLENLGYDVHKNTDNGSTLIYQINPDVLAIGSDWARKDYLSQIGMTYDELDAMNIHLLYIPYTKNISTTIIKQRLSESS